MQTKILVTIEHETGNEDQVRELVDQALNEAFDSGHYKEYSDVEYPVVTGWSKVQKSTVDNRGDCGILPS